MNEPTRKERSSESRLVRTTAAAHYLNLSRKTLTAIAMRGEIPYIRGNGLRSPWLWDIRDLDHWLERRKVKPEKSRKTR